MERFTISLDARLAREFDGWLRAHGYANRSEAVRDLLRLRIEADRLERGEAPHCVAALSYVYDHGERELAERLTARSHDHHDLCVSTMHAHLDHAHCLETVILRGETASVRAFADAIRAERGVRHGALNVVPVEVDPPQAGHRHAPGQAPHVHGRPAT